MRGESKVREEALGGAPDTGSLVSYDKDLPEVPGRQGQAHLPPTAYLERRKEPKAGSRSSLAGGRASSYS